MEGTGKVGREGMIKDQIHLYWDRGCVGPGSHSATDSVWEDLGQSLPLPGVSFLTCEMILITPPPHPSPGRGTEARPKGDESTFSSTGHTATRGRARPLLGCNGGDPFPDRAGRELSGPPFCFLGGALVAPLR